MSTATTNHNQSHNDAQSQSSTVTPGVGNGRDGEHEIAVDHPAVDPKWQSFQMLPKRFSVQRRAKRVMYAWSCILFALFSLFCGVTATFYVHGKKAIRSNEAIVAQATPLLRLKNETTKLKQQNLKIGNWSRSVASARPDDSLLQTLAAVCSATASDVNEIDIKTVHIKLALETPETVTVTPTWAKSQLQITADVVGQQTAQEWVDRINASERTSGVEIQLSAAGKWVDGTIQLIGEPTATRVLP